MIILAGIAMAINFLIIYWKLTRKRHFDAMLDGGIFFIIMIVTAQTGTISGVQVGMIASAIVSLYFVVRPPKLEDIV